MKEYPEILAPAGDEKSIIAAINAGANGVYFGGQSFNARRRGKNFDNQSLEKMIKLCKQHNIKAYIALNILIKDEELQEALDYIMFLDQCNIDGLIVQDPGLIMVLRTYYPHMPLQTSTQASVYGLQGTLFFQELGFKRVVLPREMPLDEVAKIREASDVELKVFCHGALCYAYSGQCLMSSAIGGRSGNRGLCAQPCRKKYTIVDKKQHTLKKGYVLGMKDLNTQAGIEEMRAAGVHALKIEGRLKSPEYVYTATLAYGEKTHNTVDQSALMQVFNRDFTSGWLLGDSGKINSETGKNRGVPIGKVKTCGNGQIVITLNKGVTLGLGDGLSFGEDAKEGLKIKKLSCKGREAQVESKLQIKKNTVVYRTYCEAIYSDLKTKASKKPKQIDKTPLDIELHFVVEKPTGVVAYVSGQKFEFNVDVIPQSPLKRPLEIETVEKQLAKLGDTNYVLGRLEIQMVDPVFLPLGELNALRRQIVETIESGQSNQKQSIHLELKSILPPKRKISEKKPLISLAVNDLSWWEYWIGLEVDELVLPLEALKNSEEAKWAVSVAKANHKKVLLAMPKIMDNAIAQKIIHAMDEIRTWGHDGYLVSNYEALHILSKEKLPIEADTNLHLFNTLSAKALNEWGCSSGVLSLELSGKAIQELSSRSVIDPVLMVYGHQEVMISANKLVEDSGALQKETYELIDEKGGRFPFKQDALGMVHIYNGDIFGLRGEILNHKYISKWRLVHFNESKEVMAQVIDYYAQGCLKSMDLPEQNKRYTRGSYKRGVE